MLDANAVIGLLGGNAGLLAKVHQHVPEVFGVYSATARMAVQRQQGWPVAACGEDGVTARARQGLCRAARHVCGVG